MKDRRLMLRDWELNRDRQLCLQDELSPTARKKLNQFLARFLETKGKEQLHEY